MITTKMSITVCATYSGRTPAVGDRTKILEIVSHLTRPTGPTSSTASGRLRWSQPPPPKYNIRCGSHQRRNNTDFRVGVPDVLALHEQQAANLHTHRYAEKKNGFK